VGGREAPPRRPTLRACSSARTIEVRVDAAPKIDADGAHGHVYALCRKV
jgi:hypothetical protein